MVSERELARREAIYARMDPFQAEQARKQYAAIDAYQAEQARAETSEQRAAREANDERCRQFDARQM